MDVTRQLFRLLPLIAASAAHGATEQTGLNARIKTECGSNPVISYIREIKQDVIDPQILTHARECANLEATTKVYKWRLADAGIQGCLETEYKYNPEYIKKIAPLVDDAQENTQGIMAGYNQCVNNMYQCGARFCRAKKNTITPLDDSQLGAKRQEVSELSRDYAQLREEYLGLERRKELQVDGYLPLGSFDDAAYDKHFEGKLAVMGGQMQGMLLLTALMPVVRDVAKGSAAIRQRLEDASRKPAQDMDHHTAMIETASTLEARANAILFEMVDFVQNGRR